MTHISRSKVIRRSKSYDMLGQGQWSFPPSLVKICQVMTELQRDWQKKKKEFYKDRTRQDVCRLVKKELESAPFSRARVKLGGRVSSKLRNPWPISLNPWQLLRWRGYCRHFSCMPKVNIITLNIQWGVPMWSPSQLLALLDCGLPSSN